MTRSAARHIIISQAILGICMLACLAIIPHYFFSLDQGGVSNYGTDDRTRWLFIAGFGAAAAGAILAGAELGRQATHRRGFRLALYLLGVLYLLVMVSTFPYKLSPAYRHLHEQAAILLFIGMLCLAIWLRFTLPRDRRINRTFLLFCAGFLIATLTTLGSIHLLFTGQLVSAVSFGYMLARADLRLEP